MNEGGVNYRSCGMFKFEKILKSNYQSIYNLGSVGFFFVTLNRNMCWVSNDSKKTFI